MKIENWFFFTLVLRSVNSFSEYFNTLAMREICNVRCSTDNSSCKEECLQAQEDVKVLDKEAGANVELKCRLGNGEAVMVHDPGFFIITQRSENTKWEDATISDQGMWTGSTWLTTQRYQFVLYRVFGSGLSKPETTDWIQGFVGDPMPIQNLSVHFIPLSKNHDWIGAEINFDPAEDRSCIYQVEYGISGDPIKSTIENERWRDCEADLFRIDLGNLAGDTNYTVVVQARRGHYFSTESFLDFTTPDVSDYYKVPKKVEGLNATAIHKVENIYDIYVSWNETVLHPDGYRINICSPSVEDCEDSRNTKNVSGNFTKATFTNVIISELDYAVKIWAFFVRTGSGPGNHGNFTANETLVLSNWPQQDGKLHTIIMATCLVGTILISITIGGVVFWWIRLRKRKRNQQSLEFSQSTPDEFELIPDRLVITKVLGSGAFGVVKLGCLRGDQDLDIPVAVKMLRDDTNKTDLRNFGIEMRMMKSIGKHPNIVSLLGCRTIGPYPFLVFEFCSRGDLQSFLRTSMVEATACPRSADDEKTLPTNADHSMYSHPNVEAEIVTAVDMLNYGRQIATGMDFLASNRIVHRDLAARNVLVCDDKVVKIADFGLSRDVYLENVYTRRGNNRMPLKWMSIEALSHQVYSTYSDVWSFGILLWEIVTLGGDPYPGIPAIDILKRLQSNYRMEQPATCSVPLYNVMLSCWQTKPKDRPTFTTLREELDKLICVATGDDYLVAENVFGYILGDVEDESKDSNSICPPPCTQETKICSN